MRNPETAIAGQMHRRVAGLAGRPGLDVGNALAVDRDRLVPRHHQPVGVERRRRSLEHGRRPDPAAISISDGGVSGSCDARQQIAVALRRLDIERPDADHADVAAGRPAASASSRLAGASGPRTPARRLSRIDRTSCPPLHEKLCSDAPRRRARTARRSRGSPARNASSRMPSSVSPAKVLPPTAQALRGLTASQPRCDVDLDVGRQVELRPVRSRSPARH